MVCFLYTIVNTLHKGDNKDDDDDDDNVFNTKIKMPQTGFFNFYFRQGTMHTKV